MHFACRYGPKPYFSSSSFLKTYLSFYSAKRDNQPTRHPASEEPEVQERKDSTEGRAKGDDEG